MKHFFNRRDSIVTEALDGFLATAGSGMLARLDGYPEVKVVLRADWDKTKVAVNLIKSRFAALNMEQKIRAGIMQASMTGFVALKSFWNPNVGPLTAATKYLPEPAQAPDGRLTLQLVDSSTTERARVPGYRAPRHGERVRLAVGGEVSVYPR